MPSVLGSPMRICSQSATSRITGKRESRYGISSSSGSITGMPRKDAWAQLGMSTPGCMNRPTPNRCSAYSFAASWASSITEGEP